MRICILGAGVIGLSTGVCLQQMPGPSKDITMIADKFGREVTSNAAAASFHAVNKPLVEGYDGARADPGLDIVRLAYQRWEKLYRTCPKDTGMAELEGYHLYYPPNEVDPMAENLFPPQDIRKLSEEQLRSLYPSIPPGSVGYEVKAFLISPRTHLPWLMNQFKDNGGKIHRRHVTHFDEIIDDYDIIVNCTGAGAGALTSDNEIVPSRAQVYRANIPEKKGKMFRVITRDEYPVYLYASPDGCVLGTTKQLGNLSKEFSEEDHQIIMSRLQSFFPELPDLESRITSVRIDHRPMRERGIRLEKEVRMRNGRKKWIVHQYGHGDTGFGLSWGSAVVTSEVIQSLLNESKL